jgi:hypothetical protein
MDLVKKLYTRGSQCSVNGIKYERLIYDITKSLELNGKPFNTSTTLGGCSNKIDLLCNYLSPQDIGIEIKKYNAPDFMQCGLIYKDSKWICKETHVSPITFVFNTLLEDIPLFGGNVPPFLSKPMTHNEWITIKKNTSIWNDMYISIPDDTISALYFVKGCQYIQLSTYGLYHLDEDVCKFNVPEFKIEQQMRIRIKIHTRKNKKGYCDLSVTASCIPTKIKEKLKASPYSLDSLDRLPLNLTPLL